MIQMKIEVTHARRVAFDSKQQIWDGCDKIQFAQFGGQEMLVITNEKEGFVLTYLGMTTTSPFPTMDAAKKAAPEFASSVLNYLQEMLANGQN